MRCPFRVRFAFWLAWLRVSIEVFARIIVALVVALVLIWLLLFLRAPKCPCEPPASIEGLDASCACEALEE